MHPYTELESEFNHLQKRTIQLFSDGMSREHRLKEAVVNAWNQFKAIKDMQNIEEMKARASEAEMRFEKFLKNKCESHL